MVTKSEVVDVIRSASNPEEFRELNWTGTFGQYLDIVLKHPEVLRSELAAVRQRGYAIDDAEHEPGLRCIGAPIRDQSGRVFASISLSGPAWRMPLAEVEGLAKIVVHHAGMVAARLGYAA